MTAKPEGGTAASPTRAVVLSFVWPGLGQWYAGRSRAALLYALPMLVVVAVVAARLLFAGPESLIADLASPSLALTVFILLGLLGILRLASMADALAVTGRRGRGPGDAVFAVLGAAVIVAHGWLGWTSWSIYDADSRIFVADTTPDATPSTATPNPSDPSVDFSAPPFEPTPAPSQRINILITGMDSSHDRNHSLTDTMIVASIDPVDRTVALLSFPRDISDFPLWFGGRYGGKLNSLFTYSRLNPSRFEGVGGLPALAKELGYLAGVPIQYFASINLDGFQELIDLVGGVDVVNPKPIDDPQYDWLDGTHGFTLPAGPVHLDGRIGLAYVRSRYGVGDNDYTRAARQQQVLAALRKKLTDPAVLLKLPQLIDAAASMIRTNFPSDRVDDMLGLAREIKDQDIDKIVLGPPYVYHPPTSSTGGIWTSRLVMDRLAALSIQLFGNDSRYASSGSQ